ncbi:MAG TPA: EfeM/EfeO family lipoprotein [Rugosimonospora sp.]|nr:EfeM/EfeO family lipoprotein [Rugosimonospora sp.]
MGQAKVEGDKPDERPSTEDNDAGVPAVDMDDVVADGKADATTGADTVTVAAPVTEAPRPSHTGRNRLIGVGVAVVVVAAAGVVWFATSHRTSNATKSIQITTSQCAPGWKPATNVSQQSFSIVNNSGHTGEIYLLDSNGGVIGEIEGLGPGINRTMSVPLPNGGYKWLCIMNDQPTLASAVQQVTGSSAQSAPSVLPVSDKDMDGPVTEYRAYVTPKLGDLLTQVSALHAALASSNMGAAKTAWLNAQLIWQQVGAAYGSFADLGNSIGGLPSGLPQGVQDPGFTGLHRVEYGLYHGESATTLIPVVDKLSADVTELRGKLPQLTIDPNDLSLRAHEILEDSLRDHLTGMTDLGSGAAFAETYADLQGTEVVFGELTDLITKRAPDLVPLAKQQMATLEQVLLANKHGANWTTLAQASLADRQAVNAAVSGLLETLSNVPDLLEIRSAAQTTTK